MFARHLLFLLPLAACSGSTPTAIDAKSVDAAGAADAPLIDAAPGIDARPIDAAPIDAPPTPSTVVAVACPQGAVPVVMAMSGTFSPSATTVAVDGIVKFSMPSSHSVVPDTSLSTDANLRVDFNETKCLKFTQAGTFNFKCNPHGFKGAITVN
jgi:plastocyanin